MAVVHERTYQLGVAYFITRHWISCSGVALLLSAMAQVLGIALPHHLQVIRCKREEGVGRHKFFPLC